MSILTRTSAAVAALALTAMLAACSSSDDDGDTSATPDPSASATEGEEEVDADAFAAAGTEVCTSSFTGDGEFRVAVEAFFDALNAGDAAAEDEHLADLLTAMTNVADELEALTPPAEVADTYSAAIAEIRRQVEVEEFDPPAFGDDLASIGVTGCL